MKRLLVAAALSAALLMIACSSADEKESAGTQTSTNVHESGPEIGLLDAAGFSRLLAENKGRVLLINVWATWCVPCREEFPDLVKLAESYHGKPVAIVGISADYPDEMESKVRPFLKKMNANFPNYIQQFNKDDQLIKLLNERWQGDLPATFIYDKSGSQVAFLRGKQSQASFEQAIKMALRRSVD